LLFCRLPLVDFTDGDSTGDSHPSVSFPFSPQFNLSLVKSTSGSRDFGIEAEGRWTQANDDNPAWIDAYGR
jgi:hypothetical protein